MQYDISTPVRSLTKTQGASSGLLTPVDHNRRISFSFSAPTQKQRKLDGNSTSLAMSNSSGKSKSAAKRFGSASDLSLMEDEESVLVASPFSYVTPPMPPRDEVSNTKTTRAMAKIVEEDGTPDSVIRKLSFAHGLVSSNSSFEDRIAPGTVNRASRVRSVDSDEEDEDGFRFPVATPSYEMSRVELDQDSSSDGFSRLSLSMVDLYPPHSPKPLRSMGSRGDLAESSTVPDLLLNCSVCGKQFISSKHVAEHSEFCRPDARGRLGNSQASTLAQTTDAALAQSLTDHPFIESPALPLYMQRAMAALPPVAPLPMPPSPSILASPTELRDSVDDDFLEEEISTFLECLRSDVPKNSAPIIEEPVRHNLWAARRAAVKLTKAKSEHSLCVSSDDDTPAYVLAPMPPPVPMSSNVSVNSPIPQRSSFDQETSMTASFLGGVAVRRSPTGGFGAARRSPSGVGGGSGGRTSPSFGFRASQASFRASRDTARLSVADSMAPSVTDSSMTLMRTSQRLPCGTCGRKFATVSRLEKHETVCAHVFAPPVAKQLRPEPAMRKQSEPAVEIVAETIAECKHCGRNFSHTEKLARHEHICMSVFKGQRRSKSPSVRSFVASSCSESESLNRGRRSGGDGRLRAHSTHSVCDSDASTSRISVSRPRRWGVQQFTTVVLMAAPVKRVTTLSVGLQTAAEPPVRGPRVVHRELIPQTVNQSINSSVVSSTSSSVNRTSLEFQYHLLREQIRTCSEKLKQRRSSSVPVRDG